jgi:hypothetical protein
MVSIVKKQERQQKAGRRLTIVLCSMFALLGAAMLYPFGIRPVMKAFDAEKWQQTSCRIISGEVKTHRGSKGGRTYSIEIVYDYEFAGRKYRGDKYYFVGGSSSGYSNKARIVDEYKNAANPVCFVNPDNPSEAVLVRGFRAELLFGFLFLVFMLVGIGGVIATIKKTSPTGMPQQTASTDILRLTDSSSGPVILKPKSSPKAKLAGSIVFAVIWNGVVTIFASAIIERWRNGTGEWGPTIFLIFFAAVGLLLIGIVIYFLLASFNPRPTLILSSAQIPAGSTAHLDWHFSGRIDRLKSMTITLRAKETATYQAGKNSRTDTNIFFIKEIYYASSPDLTETGQADFDIPADKMHSFEAASNKILWEIAVKGVIDKWPDIKEEFKITIVPAQAQQV